MTETDILQADARGATYEWIGAGAIAVAAGVAVGLAADPLAVSLVVPVGVAGAALLGRTYVVPDDIKVLAEPVLAHRIILRPNAEMQGQSAGKLVAGLLEREHVPQMAYDG